MMHEKQMIQSCLSHCQATSNDLKNLANIVQNTQAKTNLQQATDSLENCIKKCQEALTML